MVPLSLVLTLLCIVLAPVIVLFADNDGWLPSWLSWFQTMDNSLDGDNGWRTEHWQWRFKLPAALATYVGRVGWLWRNPAYGFGIEKLTFPYPIQYSGNTAVNDSPGVEGWCHVDCGDLWQFVWVKRITQDKCIYCVFGWNIKGLIGSDERTHVASFAFSPRISNFKV